MSIQLSTVWWFVNCELDSIWKEEVLSQLSYCPGICMQGLRESTNILRQGSPCTRTRFEPRTFRTRMWSLTGAPARLGFRYESIIIIILVCYLTACYTTCYFSLSFGPSEKIKIQNWFLYITQKKIQLTIFMTKLMSVFSFNPEFIMGLSFLGFIMRLQDMYAIYVMLALLM